jgi:hypothetical protein
MREQSQLLESTNLQISGHAISPFNSVGYETVVSQGMRGYQVFLDGYYKGTKGTGGDLMDGRFGISAVGNQNYEVRIRRN